jgi:zinc transport system substrate-binding protein
VYHDGYQYLQKEFHLNGVGTIVINPHVPLSANGLHTIQQLIQSQQVKCVFRETEFNDTLVANSLQSMGVKVAELDPLGAHQSKGPATYENIMLAIGKTMQKCLQQQQQKQ